MNLAIVVQELWIIWVVISCSTPTSSAIVIWCPLILLLWPPFSLKALVSYIPRGSTWLVGFQLFVDELISQFGHGHSVIYFLPYIGVHLFVTNFSDLLVQRIVIY